MANPTTSPSQQQSTDNIEEFPNWQDEVQAPDLSHIITEDDTPMDNIFSEKQQRLLVSSIYSSFSPGIPFLATANMDLFTPIVSPERQHQYFRFITQPGLCDPEIEVLKTWADGFTDRDGKFVKEFQTTFNSSFWELYLFACFKKLGFTVNLSYETPDFVMTSPHGEIIAEAVTTNNPKGFRPEWDQDLRQLDKISMEDILRLSTLRLLQAITDKHKKFIKTYSKLPHVQNKPFVICVSPFEQPFFFLQDSIAIIRVLYGFDQLLILPGSQDGEMLIVGESRSYRVQKKPGVDIPLGLFTNSDMADVSAVFFNNRAAFCKVRALAGSGKYPVIFYGSRAIKSETETGVQRFVTEKPDYQETLLDGFHVLLNPFAKNPLDIEVFKDREIAIHNYDIKTESYRPKIPNNFLYQRACITISPKTEESVKKYNKSAARSEVYDELLAEIWAEDKLIYVGGRNDPFCEHHMAHYNGWTILVSFDSIDEDWSALAVNKLCYSHPQFIQANGDDSIRSASLLEWFSTKEEAYTEIKHRINKLSEQIEETEENIS
ncbi:hypothetical protein [Limnoraphis robusta]|uniref:hypothetical protein n=1 Tax=Limnoraphis robusta TaxID=1118279 RepID=UPI002B2117CC|nr:hypothetical protein [Limnoraphis robusta]MEA5499124.1 hypothetical protein [Limnoraphis robusta BA-68 BA1]